MGTKLHSDNTWTRASLWLVTAAFGAFLIGLGGKLLDRMWEADTPLTLSQFIDPGAAARAQLALRHAAASGQAAQLRMEQARHRLAVANNNSALARQNFDVWLASRPAAARPDQDAELASRTSELDQVLAAQRQALAALQAEEQAAMAGMEQTRWQQQLRVFLNRLAVITPLVLLACWLFVKKRGSVYWPFIWGYIFFAAFAFFVELIPHVPTYGGYVRYLVGIAVTVLVGRFAILSLQPGDGTPSAEASARLFDGQCPGCARTLDLRSANEACAHCGLQLFKQCPECKTRKVAFARFCLSCGTPGVPGRT